ncbi:MAG: TolC family protein [Gammaproteobacteria bacterium]
MPAGAGPLSFDDALQLAEHNAPTLEAQQAQVDAVNSLTIAAAELPDPKLSIGIENFPISGPPRFSFAEEPMAMAKIGLMQEFPNSDKRRARVAEAGAAVDRARIETTFARLQVRRETALAWISRHTVEKKFLLLDELEHENRLLAEAVRARQVGAGLSPDEVVMPDVEAAMIAERRDELARDQETAKAALRRWIGPDADAPLAGDPPGFPIARDILVHRLHQHPELTAFGPMGQMLDAEVREAEAMKKPDWAVELAYQKRDADFGDMVSLMFTLDLPVFPGKRQDPQIAAKRAERLKLDAEREATLREHTAMLETDLAEYEQLGRSLQRQNETLLPLARKKVDLALAGYSAGKIDLITVIAVRRELIDLCLRNIDLEGQQLQTAARLYFTYEEDAP